MPIYCCDDNGGGGGGGGLVWVGTLSAGDDMTFPDLSGDPNTIGYLLVGRLIPGESDTRPQVIVNNLNTGQYDWSTTINDGATVSATSTSGQDAFDLMNGQWGSATGYLTFKLWILSPNGGQDDLLDVCWETHITPPSGEAIEFHMASGNVDFSESPTIDVDSITVMAQPGTLDPGAGTLVTLYRLVRTP